MVKGENIIIRLIDLVWVCNFTTNQEAPSSNPGIDVKSFPRGLSLEASWGELRTPTRLKSSTSNKIYIKLT